MVITVSRCIADRRFGSTTAITLRAAPAANRPWASSSTAAGRVRSPIPIRTQPLPITRTSPPSSMAGEPSQSLQIGNACSAKSRVRAVDDVEIDRLAGASLLGHRVHAHPVVDPRRGVAGEEVVRAAAPAGSRPASAVCMRSDLLWNGSSSNATPAMATPASSPGVIDASHASTSPLRRGPSGEVRSVRSIERRVRGLVVRASPPAAPGGRAPPRRDRRACRRRRRAPDAPA